MNKKGQLDIILIMCFMFAAAVAIYVVNESWQPIQETIMKTEAADTDTGVIAIEQANSVIRGQDTILVFVFLFMLVGTIILSFQIPSHPILFFISLLVMLISGTLAIKFSNMFTTFTSSNDFTNSTATYTATSHIMTNYPLYIIVFFFIVAIVMYAKISGRSRGAGGEV